MKNNSTFISKSIFNEPVGKTDNLNIEEKNWGAIGFTYNYLITKKLLLKMKYLLSSTNDLNYGIKDKMDLETFFIITTLYIKTWSNLKKQPLNNRGRIWNWFIELL